MLSAMCSTKNKLARTGGESSVPGEQSLEGRRARDEEGTAGGVQPSYCCPSISTIDNAYVLRELLESDRKYER